MRYLSGKDAQEALKYLEVTERVASRSLCLRSKYGSVVVKSGKVIGIGYNSPPRNSNRYRTCLHEYRIPAGFRHDRTCCVHAEQRAVLDALKKNQKKVLGSRIYTVLLDEKGNKDFCEELRCTICSRAVLDAGVAEFVLRQRKGIALYRTDEADRFSYKYRTPRGKDRPKRR